MFNKIQTVDGLKAALSTGLVALAFTDDKSQGMVTLLVTTNQALIGRVSRSHEITQLFVEQIRHADSGKETVVVFDVIHQRAVNFNPAIFAGQALSVGTVDGYQGIARSVLLDLRMGASVRIKGDDGFEAEGTVVAVNPSAPEHYYVVLLGVEHSFKSLTFDRKGESVNQGCSILDQSEGSDFAWIDDEGYEYFPAIDLNENGYSVPCPLIFVVYDNHDATKTIALDSEGKDSFGTSVLKKIKVDYRAVETERYLIANGRGLLLVSHEYMDSLKDMKDFSLPVLAYYKGLDVVHITLPSKG